MQHFSTFFGFLSWSTARTGNRNQECSCFHEGNEKYYKDPTNLCWPSPFNQPSWQQQPLSLLFVEYFLLHQSAAHLGSSPDFAHAFIRGPRRQPPSAVQLLFTSACSCHCQTTKRKSDIGRGNFPHGTCNSQRENEKRRENRAETHLRRNEVH